MFLCPIDKRLLIEHLKNKIKNDRYLFKKIDDHMEKHYMILLWRFYIAQIRFKYNITLHNVSYQFDFLLN